MYLGKQMESWPANMGQIKGNNRQMRYWSPEARAMLLKNRAPELEAFAQDRSIDARLLFSVAEAVMRLGRIPELTHYGFSADDERAVTHFMADVIMNTEDEDEDEGAERVDETTVANSMGPFLKYYQGLVKRTAVQPTTKLFDLPSQPEKAPEAPYKHPGIGNSSSPFNNDAVIPSFKNLHIVGGEGAKKSPLEVFRNKIRAFQKNKSGKFGGKGSK